MYILASQRNDKCISNLFVYVSNPIKETKDIVGKQYRAHLNRIFIDDNGILNYKSKNRNCIITPELYRQEILELCHASYLSEI